MTLFLQNTLTRKKEAFQPLDPKNVRLYVCGPTVYDRAHIGNARSVIVYDVLYRLLGHIYGESHVTYVRNITDVDDKINAAAKEQGIPIGQLTTEVTKWFHEDMQALGCLPPTKEPRATNHITQMIAMIQALLQNGNAYEAQGNVLFSVKSTPLNPSPRVWGEDQGGGWHYGMLSGRVQDDLESGARVKAGSYKRDPNDFVLWKPAVAGDDPSSVFDSPWGKGRPGWHIECSAMSTHYLGQDFDIHGGGSDLMFPHHENEIAQSCCATPGSHFARYWVHNGFLTVNGEKMSKSLGNFITVRDLLNKKIKGEVIRYALLKTKYNEPLDWNEKLLSDAKKELDSLYRKLDSKNTSSSDSFIEQLRDDINTPKALSILHVSEGNGLKEMGKLLGILQQEPKAWFQGESAVDDSIQSLIDARIAAKSSKNWVEADRIRAELKSQGIILEDRPDGTTDWRKES